MCEEKFLKKKIIISLTMHTKEATVGHDITCSSEGTSASHGKYGDLQGNNCTEREREKEAHTQKRSNEDTIGWMKIVRSRRKIKMKEEENKTLQNEVDTKTGGAGACRSPRQLSLLLPQPRGSWRQHTPMNK